MSGKAYRGGQITLGEFGLKALEPGWVTSRQIEAARIAITRYVKRGGQVWTSIFPDKPITKKPAETRMGKGKGNPEYWVAVVKPGRILYEMDGVTPDIAREAFRLASHKLPIATKCVVRGEFWISRRDVKQEHAYGSERIEQLTGAELYEKEKQLVQELFNLRFQFGTGRLENPMQIRKTKRSIAQVKTVQREVEQAEQKKAS